MLGGLELDLEGDDVAARIDASRTTAGWALRLRASATVAASCVRCLEPAALDLRIDAREIDQADSDDPELTSPYVEEELLDAVGWLSDALALALPDQPLCRPGCAGLCAECGIVLNDLGPEGHSHERPLDPRFAKLRELEGGS